MKIHINIKDDVDPIIALECVKKVIRQGRMSNGGKMYSYATIFDTSEGEVWVETMPYRKSDCFCVRRN